MNLQSIMLLIFSIIIILIDGTVGQIVDGMDAQKDHFKYQVMITAKVYLCGGAIIDEIHVLTAAHCLHDSTVSDITVLAGMNNVSDSNTTVRWVKEVHIHPNYSIHGSEYTDDLGNYTLSHPLNDVAVITLSIVIPLGGNIATISLPTTSIPYCHTSIIAGWGYTNLNGCFPDKLQFTIMIILDPITCRRKGAIHRANEFCAYSSDQMSIIAPGDSGSALCSYGEIVGITSYGWDSPVMPVIFTKVYDHLDFINGAISDTSS